MVTFSAYKQHEADFWWNKDNMPMKLLSIRRYSSCFKDNSPFDIFSVTVAEKSFDYGTDYKNWVNKQIYRKTSQYNQKHCIGVNLKTI